LVDNWDTPDKTQLTESFRSETPILRLEDSVKNSAENDTRLPSTILGRGDFIKDLQREAAGIHQCSTVRCLHR
jgi:hypothetical protein